jgi:SAM-dependent methyltransferase
LKGEAGLGYNGAVPPSIGGRNRETFGRAATVRRYASLERLFPAEAALLSRLGPSLRSLSLLDLGVGGGRTTPHFAPACAAYRGADYAPAMVEACRRRFAGRFPEGAFAVADARALPPEWTGAFGAVLFSYNGLDFLDCAERTAALREIARVCAPGAWFLFSSHNLNAVAAARAWPAAPGFKGKLAGALDHACYRLLNPGLRRVLGGSQGVLRDRGNRLRARNHYIRPGAQALQLEEHGFVWVDAYPALAGEPFPDRASAEASTAPWIYYLARKAGSAPSPRSP